MKRRAESARIVRNKIGVETKKENKQTQNLMNVVNFDDVQPSEVNKSGRPRTAFIPQSLKNRE